MTTAVATIQPKKKRIPKRLTSDQLKERVESREKKADHKGAESANIKWETLRFDETLRRQFITINTVDENNKTDGNIREVATSDLQHVCHTKELSDSLKRKRQNVKRAEKRKTK
jgi:hypothetical protein